MNRSRLRVVGRLREERRELRAAADEVAHGLGEAVCDGELNPRSNRDLLDALERLEALLPDPAVGWWRTDPRFLAAKEKFAEMERELVAPAQPVPGNSGGMEEGRNG
jgi:hypothetical protein